MSDFIPKQYKKEPITIHMDFEKLEKIDNPISKYYLSRSEFINQCINYILEHIPNLETSYRRLESFR